MRTHSYTACIAAVAAVAVLTVLPARAHHAFSSDFDSEKPVNLEGPVSKLEWVNPHAWIHVDVKSPDGKVETWMIETGSPNVLLRRGFNKSMVQIGTVIRVKGYAAKGGSRKANGGEMTLPDGRVLLIGSTGTGAPEEKKK
jgi:hypothetical protein